MTQTLEAAPSVADTSELCSALERELSRHFCSARSITCLERRPSDYQSSFPLEELRISLDDGTSLQLMFKDLGPCTLPGNGRLTKPAFLLDPRREIETYLAILQPARLGTATCYGAVYEPTIGRAWLFLEKVAGIELYQIGDLDIWHEVARWLARFHAHFAGDSALLGSNAHLLCYDADYYRLWIRRALDFWPDLAPFAGILEAVARRLLTLPVTFIHGEFYVSNILVHAAGGELRVCPIDWEMAALGPGLMDLAALTAGPWSDDVKQPMALAYHEALPSAAALHSMSANEFLQSLDWCRLHHALQWLSWSADWSPPAAHAQDWRNEAQRLIEKIASAGVV
jgi:hypothetical protein